MTKSVEKILADEQLPLSFKQNVLPYYQQLADHLLAIEKNRCQLIAINGAQGTGKSTLCLFLKAFIEQTKKRAVVISLDDIYLKKQERLALANKVHPLLKTRGVPGTHDLALGQTLIQQLTSANIHDLTYIPRFSKAHDDRAEKSQWTKYTGRPDFILFEGWCMGAQAEAETQLDKAINRLEQKHDANHCWRRYVNNILSKNYQIFFNQFEKLIMLKAPNFQSICEWRELQEKKLAKKMQKKTTATAINGTRQINNDKLKANSAFASNLSTMDKSTLHFFMMHYQRLTEHMLKEMPNRADILLHINKQHGIETMEIH